MRVEELREWLDEGRPVLVLDVRPAGERQEWHIPGSLFVPGAYEAVKAGDFRSLEAIPFPQGLPVVVVCASGQTSQQVAAYLNARGVAARSLEGGMKAWSLAWNLAELELPAGTRVYQVRRAGCRPAPWSCPGTPPSRPCLTEGRWWPRWKRCGSDWSC